MAWWPRARLRLSRQDERMAGRFSFPALVTHERVAELTSNELPSEALWTMLSVMFILSLHLSTLIPPILPFRTEIACRDDLAYSAERVIVKAPLWVRAWPQVAISTQLS